MSEKPEFNDRKAPANAEEHTQNVLEPVLRLHRALKICALLLAALLLAGVLIWGVIQLFAFGRSAIYQNEFPAMGTVAKVSVYTGGDDLQIANEICQKEFAAVVQVCSLYDPQSELSRLNASAAGEPFVCSEMMWELLMRARTAYVESDGYFDITIKPLMDLWGFYQQRGTPPDALEIRETMRVVGFDKLVFDEEKRTLCFSVPGMAIDLGGIAKGYAADRAAKAIRAAGITSGVIDLGGNLRMLPDPPPGKDFYRVAIRDPHHAGEILDEKLSVRPGMAVSSSGDYERFVVYNGRRYGHIISPKTGYPATVSAVTVVADNAMDADVFSTSCCLGGEAVAAGLKTKYPGITIHFTR
ncbi:MAG: FAD:protein FMN transferase [Lentisphaeria bacterium]|nr:FAD:protein FMN transferase [Lentisphaeria bacterium]